MKRKLLQIAVLSSPIMAFIAAVPAYLIDERSFDFFLKIGGILTVVIFLFWSINIALLNRTFSLPYYRYVASYFLIFILQAINVTCMIYWGFKPKQYNIILPFMGAFFINTLILIIINTIQLDYEKKQVEIEMEQLKVSHLEAQKHLLMQQLHPHFLFNTLSTLKALIPINTLLAEEYVVKLSDFLRYSIQAQHEGIVSLEQELKFSKDYFDLQKVRFGEAIFCEVKLSEDFFSGKVPVFAIQTLFENAIKHNSFTSKNPLYIDVSLVNNKIEVRNNRIVKALILPSGVGLQNLNLRYEMIAGRGIEVKETEDSFIVSIELL